MSKATTPTNRKAGTKIFGFKGHKTRDALIAKCAYTRLSDFPDAVIFHVSVVDWGGHPLFPRMARLYAVDISTSTAWTSDPYVWERLYLGWHVRTNELTWTEVIELIGFFWSRWNPSNYDAPLPLCSTVDGGYSERICREIHAAHPHHDLQGRGDGK
jgi:hypothetical protein